MPVKKIVQQWIIREMSPKGIRWKRIVGGFLLCSILAFALWHIIGSHIDSLSDKEHEIEREKEFYTPQKNN